MRGEKKNYYTVEWWSRDWTHHPPQHDHTHYLVIGSCTHYSRVSRDATVVQRGSEVGWGTPAESKSTHARHNWPPMLEWKPFPNCPPTNLQLASLSVNIIVHVCGKNHGCECVFYVNVINTHLSHTQVGVCYAKTAFSTMGQDVSYQEGIQG